MFIRRRSQNKPLGGLLLIVFLFCSGFTQSSGVLSGYIKSFGCKIEKSKRPAPSTFQYPCEKSEKEEKKSGHKSVFLSFNIIGVLFTLVDTRKPFFYADPIAWGDATYPPLYLLVCTLRL